MKVTEYLPRLTILRICSFDKLRLPLSVNPVWKNSNTFINPYTN